MALPRLLRSSDDAHTRPGEITHAYPREAERGEWPPSTPVDNRVVGLGACVIFLLAAALASQVAPPRRSARRRHFSTREAVLALCGATVVCCTIAIFGTSLSHHHVRAFTPRIEADSPFCDGPQIPSLPFVDTAAGCSALHNSVVNALFGTCVAFSQGVNGFLTLERYMVLHPHMKVSCCCALSFWDIGCPILPLPFSHARPPEITSTTLPTRQISTLARALAISFVFAVFVMPFLINWVSEKKKSESGAWSCCPASPFAATRRHPQQHRAD